MDQNTQSNFKAPSLFDYRPAAYKGETPPRRDVVEGRLPRGKVVLLAGAGDVGKSFLLLHAYEAINGGLEREAFGGRIAMGPPLPCICIMAEDDFASIDLRLKSIRSHHNCTLPDHGAILPAPNIGNMQLVRRDYANRVEATEILDWLEGQIAELQFRHGDLGFVAIDTFSSLLPVDANSADEVQGALSLLTSIAAKYDVCIIITHHLRKDSSDRSPDGLRAAIRGSTAIVDGVRAAYVLNKLSTGAAADIRRELDLEIDGEVIQLSLVKNNLGLRRDPVTYIRMPDGCLWDVTNLLGTRLTPEQALWQIVRESNERGVQLNKTGQKGLYANRLPSWPGGLGNMAKTAIELLANQLIAEGRLASGPNGLMATDNQVVKAG